ncbi:hypothetical protein FSP39_000829 [Pinctada imbricata]|uniref:PHD-type domain-containing protein n=1 Tax=Pinctada imbricata TaxID=66713 RepID=A0AA88YD93_PINIB|nr:hypothetical protein FSP39_000829 [Pinctada imbricata]
MAYMNTSTPINKRARVGSNSCPKCDKEFESETESIMCCICELNFCHECTKIPAALLSALELDPDNNFKWTCSGCKQNFPCMTGLKLQLHSIEENTQKRLDIMDFKIASIDSNVDSKIENKISSVKKDLAQEIKEEIKNSLQDDVRKEVKEIEDQKQRMLNLICFYMPESKSKLSEERKKEDLDNFIDLCTKIGVNDPDIKLAFRLGNYKEDSTNIRPLKIIFNNKKDRKDILDNVTKIRKIGRHDRLSKCIISKDLTVRQRQANKQRREEKANQMKKPQREEMQIDYSLLENTTILEKTQDKLYAESQPLLCTVYDDPFLAAGIGLAQSIPPHVAAKSQVSPFSDLDLGEDTIIGGYDTEQHSSQNRGAKQKTNR